MDNIKDFFALACILGYGKSYSDFERQFKEYKEIAKNQPTKQIKPLSSEEIALQMGVNLPNCD